MCLIGHNRARFGTVAPYDGRDKYLIGKGEMTMVPTHGVVPLVVDHRLTPLVALDVP